jgi:hypothetical protein
MCECGLCSTTSGHSPGTGSCEQQTWAGRVRECSAFDKPRDYQILKIFYQRCSCLRMKNSALPWTIQKFQIRKYIYMHFSQRSYVK